MTRVNTLKNHPWVFKRLYMGLIDELRTMLNFYSCKENATGKSFPNTALHDLLVYQDPIFFFLNRPKNAS